MKINYTVEEITETRNGWRVTLMAPIDGSVGNYHRTITLCLPEKPKWHIAQTVEGSFLGR